MAITVQMQFESAVTEMYQDAFVGSSIENGVTIITFDLRQHDFHQELGTPARLCWRKESYHVDVHELSTFHNPITYRFILDVHFISSSPVELQLAYRVEGDTRHVQSVEGGD